MFIPLYGDQGPKAQQDLSIRRRLEAEMLLLLYKQAHGGTRLGMLAVLPLALLLFQVHPVGLTVAWTGAILSLYALRYVWLLRLLRETPAQRGKGAGLVVLDVLVFLSGTAWGLAAWLFHSPIQTLHQAVLMFAMAGIMGFGPQTFSARPTSIRLFTVPVALGLITRLLSDPAPGSWVFAAMVAVFFVVCIASGRGLYLNLRHSILLRLEKDQLVRSLTEAKERAEESAAAKSDFLATMSHEIRTPMNGLMGMLEILRETQLSNSQLNYLNTASRSAEALLQLLNDILDFSKIEVGRLEMESIPFDWIAMIGEIALLNRVLATERGIGFHLDIPAEGTAIVQGDPTRLRQILNNLLSNALKFTHEGSVRLRAEIESETAEAVSLCFRVSDTGIGIDAEAQGRLFKQFQQADASMSRKYGGSGLGLAISQRLTQLMGGTISFTSALGEGSEFTLRLTFPKARTQQELPLAHDDSKRMQYDARVLLVEDDAVSQRVAVLMLKSFGILPTVVDNGPAAVEQATRGDFDIVFLDCHLPGLNGFDAARAIRSAHQSSRGSKPVIVALTANNGSDDRARAVDAGMDDFISKPVRKREMRICLERWLVRKQG